MYDIAFGPIVRRGGCWGYFRIAADSSTFIARAWRTKRDANAARLRDAKASRLTVKLLTAQEA